MTTSNSRLAYHDCIEVFEKALADDFGCRVRFKSYNDANYYRMRMHTARTLDRRDNKQLYHEQPDHQLYGRSVFDVLVCKVVNRDDSWWMYVQKSIVPGDIEALSDLSQSEREVDSYSVEQVSAPTEQLQIEHIRRRV